jgi:chromosome segregation protein
MRLKRIYVSGFKSIADKLDLEFGHGVTCIVGPNGCGKSNISDSVRWVLGEQNPRNLRANKMQDLIFGGTSSRKAEAMAEVRLTIDNQDNGLNLPYTEVEISRRLYRSGDSEYRINKEVVRLKDILDLLSNTGIGTTSYSLLEQGRVDAILTSKPSERRALFEEAAEITTFRMRQDEALRKLKRTDQDLQRLNDIIGELDRQVRSLKFQANKASRYNRFHHRLKQLELIRMDRQRCELDERIERDQNEKKQAKERKASLDIQIEQSEKDLGVIRGQVEEARTKVTSVETARAEIQSEIRRHDDQLAHNRQMESELKGQEERTRELERNLVEELQRIEDDLEKTQSASERLARELTEIETEEQFFASQESEGRADYDRSRKAADEAAQSLGQVERSIESVGLEVQSVEAGFEKIRQQEEKLQAEVVQGEEELREIESKFSAGQSHHESARAGLQEGEAERDRLRAELHQLDQAIEEIRKASEVLHAERSRHNHRLESLRELQSHHEGHGEGVKQAMDKKEKGVHPFSAIEGLLIEQLRVDSGFEDAVETALSSWLESVLCQDRESAQEILRSLRQSGGARLSCLPLDVLKQSEGADSAQLPEWARVEGAVTADRVTTVSPQYSGLLSPILRKTLIVPEIEDLFACLGGLQAGWLVVTRTGEVGTYPGLVTGGKSVTTGYLRRQSEIDHLETELASLNERWEATESQLAERRETRRSLSEALRGREEEIQRLVVAIAAKQEELQGLAHLREKVENSLQRLQDSFEFLANDRKKLSDRKFELENRRENLEREVERRREETAAKREEQRRLEEALNDLRAKHQRHRETLVALQKDSEGCANEIRHLTERRDHNEERIAELRREAEERSRKIQECAGRKEQAEKSLRDLFERMENVEKDLAEYQVQLSRILEAYSTAEGQAKELHQMLSAQIEKIQEVEVASHRAALEKENLERRLTEEFQSTWEEAAGAIEGLEDLPETLEQLTSEIMSLRDRIQKMGEVNPLALEEYEEQSARLDFLTSQKDDLEKAKGSLHRTISELKRTARKRFLEVFEAIRQNFNQTFRKVFGGGRADLILLDEADVLSSGIEIVAQPPGKKLQSITLFSGGEKSMTAISLLFAVFRVKASPFCFLDEVDAALDDANVDRFARLLTDFRRDSQFIIVTHNKHTMAAADRLYGVTMPKPGQSTVMSMEFENRTSYNLDPLPEPEFEALPERDYDAAMREAEARAAAGEAGEEASEPLEGEDIARALQEGEEEGHEAAIEEEEERVAVGVAEDSPSSEAEAEEDLLEEDL